MYKNWKKHKLKEEILQEGDKNFADGSFDMKSFFLKKNQEKCNLKTIWSLYIIFFKTYIDDMS